MDDVDERHCASYLPVDVHVVGVVLDLLASGSFKVRLLPSNLAVDPHS